MTRVLLYSGGLDSYAAAYVWKPDVLLHVDMGTAYGKLESELLAQHSTPRDLPLHTAALPLAPWERSDGIIPLRNLFLACVAAQYGDSVALAATAGDRVLDKSQPFAEQASELLSYLWQPQHWTAGHRVAVSLPVKGHTKRQLVRAAVESGCDPDRLATETFSCYTPTPQGDECGACKPCARKWIALRANGYRTVANAEHYVREHYASAIKDGTWDRGADEARDVLDALGAST